MVVNDLVDENITVGAIIEFKTPFTLSNPETGEGDVSLPNGTNETYIGVPFILINGQDFEDVVGNGTIHYTQNFNYQATSNSFTSNISFNGNTLQINYNGAFTFVNEAAQGARPSATGVNKTLKTKLGKTSKNNSLKKLRLN